MRGEASRQRKDQTLGKAKPFRTSRGRACGNHKLMRFAFSKLFYALLAVGLVPLSLSWNRPVLRWLAFAYDLVLVALAIFDARNSRLPTRVGIERHFGSRFAVGAETEVRLDVANHTPRDLSLIVKDEYPPQMKLAGAREARLHVDGQTGASFAYWLTP